MTTELTKAAQQDITERLRKDKWHITGVDAEEAAQLIEELRAQLAKAKADERHIYEAYSRCADERSALTHRPAAQTEREAFALARAFALATTASEEFVRCNGLSTGEADEFILTGPDLTDEHATACVEHLKHVGECVAFDCDDGVIVRLGDFTLGSLS